MKQLNLFRQLFCLRKFKVKAPLAWLNWLPKWFLDRSGEICLPGG